MIQLSKIESVQNSMVKHAYSLKIPKKSKDLEDFLCEGFHLVREALKSGLKNRFIFGTKEAWENAEGKEILALAQREKVRCFEVTGNIISYISDTVTPQGILAVVGKMPSQWPAENYSRVLAVYQVQDAGNMGTLFRSAEAFGVQAVLLTEGCSDPYNPKVVRASMGSLFRVPFVHGEKWEACQDWLKQKNFHTYALAAQAAEPLPKVKFSTPLAFWVGSEGAGLPEALVAACEGAISIPMTGQVESLNVGVAASLALFWAHFQGPVS
ncbi:MAG TPA: RNA methyltransferase [bacterium]|nr:RNA methyltransferase [bacterium]